MKRIIFSFAVITLTVGALLGGTTAFFSDVETSRANTFTAGALDLKVDNESYYNGNKCAEVTAGVWQWQGEASYPVPGTPCTTSWTLTDLDEGNLFFDFTDVKPDDEGEDTISLHVQNDAYACMDITLTSNDDNSSNEPELKTGDAEENALNEWDGELAQAIQMLWWADDGDNVHEVGEAVISGGVKTVMDLASTTGAFSVALADATHNVWGTPGPIPAEETAYIAKAWCFGTLTPAPLPDNADTGPLVRGTGILCDGKTLGNVTQTDTATLDIQFRTEQARHNGQFLCNEEVVVEPEDGTLTVVKNVIGSDAQPDDFSFVVGSDAPIPFDVSGSNIIQIAPGQHSVVETPAEGYTTTYANSQNGNANCEDLVVPPEGNVTCTITNTFVPETGTLVVRKVFLGGPEIVDIENFTFQINGDSPVSFEPDAQNDFVLAPGQYSVVEGADDSYSATYSSVNGANCNNLQVVADQETICTITNTYDPTTITIQKNVVGGNLVAGDFSFELDNIPASLNTPYGVTEGTHLVEEVNTPADYIVTYGGACDTDGNVSVVTHESATCIITNTYVPPTGTLTITKSVVGGPSAGQPEDFAFAIDGGSSDPFEEDGTNVLVLSPGDYDVLELATTDYVATYANTENGSLNCTDLTVVANQNVTCTITNQYSPTTITVQKTVVGGAATVGSFTYRIDGNAVQHNTATPVTPGVHTVTETDGPANYVATFGGACDAQGQVTAFANANVICTITNTFVPPTPTTITITKSVVGGTATTGSFTYRIDGNAVPLNTANTVTAGAHTVTETGGPANYVATFGGSCNASGTITAVSNTNVTCTITNTFVAPTTTIWSSSFGTSGNNDVPDWDETTGDTSAATGGGASPNGGAYAFIGDQDAICRSVPAGYTNMNLAYYWKGDVDAEDNEAGLIQYRSSSAACNAGGGWTTLATHELDDGNNGVDEGWSSLQALGIPNGAVQIRILNNASDAGDDNEFFRIDGVSLTGVAM
jgi:predicted ribosomally synthesized peptide with SipW-like signal peptide